MSLLVSWIGNTDLKASRGEDVGDGPILTALRRREFAAVLDKADAIRRKRRETIGLTEELLRSVFLEMFGDPVANLKGWPERPLHEVADLASGVTKGKKYGSLKLVEVPYMRVANVQDGHLALDEIKTISVSTEEAERYRLRIGDVLLTEGGDPDKLGRGAVWRGEIPESIHQNHIFRARPSREVLPEYLSALLGSSRGKRYFLRAAKQTTGIASINMTQLRAFPALIPPLSAQQRYVDAVSKLSAVRERLAVCNSTSDAFFSSILHRSFSGQLTASAADTALEAMATQVAAEAPEPMAPKAKGASVKASGKGASKQGEQLAMFGSVRKSEG